MRRRTRRVLRRDSQVPESNKVDATTVNKDDSQKVLVDTGATADDLVAAPKKDDEEKKK